MGITSCCAVFFYRSVQVVLVDFGDSYSMIIRLVSMSDDRNLQSCLLFYVNDWFLECCFLLCLTLTTDNQLALSLGIWAMSSTAYIFSVDSRKTSDVFKISSTFSEKNSEIFRNLTTVYLVLGCFLRFRRKWIISIPFFTEIRAAVAKLPSPFLAVGVAYLHNFGCGA